MRTAELLPMAVTMVLVPWLAWMFGRFAGRRDWRITALVCAGTTLAVLTGAACHFALSPKADPIAALATRPELAVFLVILGIMMAMLGWASVPALPRSGENTKSQ